MDMFRFIGFASEGRSATAISIAMPRPTTSNAAVLSRRCSWSSRKVRDSEVTAEPGEHLPGTLNHHLHVKYQEYVESLRYSPVQSKFNEKATPSRLCDSTENTPEIAFVTTRGFVCVLELTTKQVARTVA